MKWSLCDTRETVVSTNWFGEGPLVRVKGAFTLLTSACTETSIIQLRKLAASPPSRHRAPYPPAFSQRGAPPQGPNPGSLPCRPGASGPPAAPMAAPSATSRAAGCMLPSPPPPPHAPTVAPLPPLGPLDPRLRGPGAPQPASRALPPLSLPPTSPATRAIMLPAARCSRRCLRCSRRLRHWPLRRCRGVVRALPPPTLGAAGACAAGCPPRQRQPALPADARRCGCLRCRLPPWPTGCCSPRLPSPPVRRCHHGGRDQPRPRPCVADPPPAGGPPTFRAALAGYRRHWLPPPGCRRRRPRPLRASTAAGRALSPPRPGVAGAPTGGRRLLNMAAPTGIFDFLWVGTLFGFRGSARALSAESAL